MYELYKSLRLIAWLDTFEINRERAIDYLNTRDLVYVFDGFAGWDPRYRIKVRVVCARAYHALFMVSIYSLRNILSC